MRHYLNWALKYTSMTIDEAFDFAKWASDLYYSPYDAFRMYTAQR